MATTSTQSKNPASVFNMAVGRYIIESGDTAAAFVLTIGFLARYFKIVNLAATGGSLEWFEGMADASALKRVTAGDFTLITTLGITVAATTVTVGLDTDINVKAEQLSWMAIG